jgi:hypothetical protein
VPGASNETMVTVGLLGVGIYFSVLVVRGLLGYLRFRRVRPTALLTWPGRPPSHFRFLLGLGVLSLVLTVINGYLNRPFHHVYGLAVMALYFMLMVPLSARIDLGLYRDGVWADTGFLPYAKIKRIAFDEGREIVLRLLARGRSGAVVLPIPRDEYGAVRKILDEKIRERAVNMEEGILPL